MEPLANIHDLIGREGETILWWQMSLRAVVVMLFGLALVRVAGKRLFGKWGAIDIILSVIIGSNLSRALTGNAPLFETLVASAVLVSLHWALTAGAVRLSWLGPLVKGNPAKLIADGEVDEAALRRHGVGDNDLEEAFRCAGVRDASQVESAWIERNGEISIIKR